MVSWAQEAKDLLETDLILTTITRLENVYFQGFTLANHQHGYNIGGGSFAPPVRLREGHTMVVVRIKGVDFYFRVEGPEQAAQSEQVQQREV